MAQTLGSSSTALPSSTPVRTTWAMPQRMSIFRRSTWSASAPPYRPKTISGTSSTSAIAPTAKLEPVSR
jgi:hypothetical protein